MRLHTSELLRTVKLGLGEKQNDGIRRGPLHGSTPSFPKAYTSLLKYAPSAEESRRSPSFQKLISLLKVATGQEAVDLTIGTSSAFFQTVWCARERFSTAVIERPYYEPYLRVLQSLDYKIEYLDRYADFSRTLKQADSLRSKTSLVMISNPHFYHGHLQTHEQLEKLCDGFGLVIVDEVHLPQFAAKGDFSFKLKAYNAITISGFAKPFGLSNLRLGWAAGPEELIMPIRDSGLLMNTDLPYPSVQIGLQVFKKRNAILKAIKSSRAKAQREAQKLAVQLEMAHDFKHGFFASLPAEKIKPYMGRPSDIFGVQGLVRIRIDQGIELKKFLA